MANTFLLTAPFAKPTLVRRTVAAALSLVRAMRHRHEVMRLLELDDRALKDIGLLRNDVYGALAEPFYRDPSTLLVERRVRVRT